MKIRFRAGVELDAHFSTDTKCNVYLESARGEGQILTVSVSL
jgi:hypothetical protein